MTEKREARRIRIASLTPAQEERRRKALVEIEAEKEELLAIGRKAKAESVRHSRARNLGERLRAVRAATQMTQQPLAKAACATPLAADLGATVGGLQASLSQIESGVVANPGILTVDVLCRGLGVSIGELMEN